MRNEVILERCVRFAEDISVIRRVRLMTGIALSLEKGYSGAPLVSALYTKRMIIP